MTGVVADGVRLDLGRSEAVEEALRERAVDQRARAGVVRVEDACRPRARRRCRSRPSAIAAIASGQPIGSNSPSPFGPIAAQRRVSRTSGSRKGAVVADRALTAELAARDVVPGSPRTCLTRPSSMRHQHAAGVVAVARARRAHGLHATDDGRFGRRASPMRSGAYDERRIFPPTTRPLCRRGPDRARRLSRSPVPEHRLRLGAIKRESRPRARRGRSDRRCAPRGAAGGPLLVAADHDLGRSPRSASSSAAASHHSSSTGRVTSTWNCRRPGGRADAEGLHAGGAVCKQRRPAGGRHS